MAVTPLNDDPNTITQTVNERYGNVAIKALSNQGEAATYHNVAAAFGYSDAELQALPDNANLGLSCGNPIALANLQENETIIDFGSGAGFDIFIAARKVGDNGRAIGIDQNDNMLKLARQNAQKQGYTNVSFVKGAITSVPLDSAIAHCIISNCVVNLVPHASKHLVFKEMYRLLRKGGRVAVSDLLARKRLPEEIRGDVAAYVGCIAGAAEVGDYEVWLREAGFDEIVIVDTNQDTNVYKAERPDGAGSGSGSDEIDVGCCAGTSEKGSGKCLTKPSLADYDLNEWIGSYKIFALKT